MQLTLLDAGRQGPALTPLAPRRHPLDATAWVDVQQGFVSGQAQLFEQLRQTLDWAQHRRRMYDRYVDVPRLTSRGKPSLPLPVIDAMASALGLHYGVELSCLSFALYRDGQDSVAWHADTELVMWAASTVALVILGEPRPFMLRSKNGGGSATFRPGWGDLLVMGGSCQHGWEHCVPKVATSAPRLSVMFRPPNEGAEAGLRRPVENVHLVPRRLP